MKNFLSDQRVIRVACPPECGRAGCPGHIPIGSVGVLSQRQPERLTWYNEKTEKNEQAFAWLINWGRDGAWWTIDHCFKAEDQAPGFPDAVWTEV